MPRASHADDLRRFEPIGPFADVWSRCPFERGGFCYIDASPIDLASQLTCTPEKWMTLVSSHTRSLFETPDGGLLKSFWEQLRAAPQGIPPP